MPSISLWDITAVFLPRMYPIQIASAANNAVCRILRWAQDGVLVAATRLGWTHHVMIGGLVSRGPLAPSLSWRDDVDRQSSVHMRLRRLRINGIMHNHNHDQPTLSRYLDIPATHFGCACSPALSLTVT